MLPVVTKQKKTHVIVPISRTFLKGYMAAGKERKLVLSLCLLRYSLSFCPCICSIIHLLMGLGAVIEQKALNKGKTSTVVQPSPLNDLCKRHQQNHIKTKTLATRPMDVLCSES